MDMNTILERCDRLFKLEWLEAMETTSLGDDRKLPDNRYYWKIELGGAARNGVMHDYHGEGDTLEIALQDLGEKLEEGLKDWIGFCGVKDGHYGMCERSKGHEGAHVEMRDGEIWAEWR